MRTERKNYADSGQVLVVGIIMLLILLLAIFIFFDVHNMIRAKIKVETAEQAAALAAARWQGESLNLIGEMNLMIASEAILASSEIAIPNAAANKTSRATSIIKSINELQTRVAFLGPIIGLNAAQQTAKNNGISPKYELSEGVIYDYRTSIEEDELDDDSKYPNKVNGFLWKKPYKQMLADIADAGVTVRPSGNANGIENITPRFLADESFYHAVLAAQNGGNSWCHYHLRILVKKPDDFFVGKSWYMPNYLDIHKHFIKQSEIYSLYVNLDENKAVNSYYADFLALLKRPNVAVLSEFNAGNLGNYNVLDQRICRFFIYDDRYFPSRYSYNGPDVAGPDAMWQRGMWLREDLKPEFVFGGAAAYAEVYQGTSTATSFKKGKKEDKKVKTLASEKSENYIKIGGNFGAVARAFSSKYNPVSVPIVAPLYDQTALIPSTMLTVRRFTMEIPLVEKFIKYLAENDVDIHNPHPAPPAGTEFMLQALQLMADPAFRKMGYNTDFPGLDLINHMALFGDSYKYPNRKDGAGYLQQACLRYMTEPPPLAVAGRLYYFDTATAIALNKKLLEEYNNAIKTSQRTRLIQYPVPESNEVWVFNGQRYFVIRNGKIMDNENDPVEGCAAWYGNGGGISGINTGPSHL